MEDENEKESTRYYEEEECQRVSELKSVFELFLRRPNKAITTLDGMGVLRRRKDGRIMKLPKEENGVTMWSPVCTKRRWNILPEEAHFIHLQGFKTVGSAIYRPELLRQLMDLNPILFRSVTRIGSKPINLSTDDVVGPISPKDIGGVTENVLHTSPEEVLSEEGAGQTRQTRQTKQTREAMETMETKQTRMDKWAKAMLTWDPVSRPYRCLIHAAFEDSAMWKKEQCSQLLAPSMSACSATSIRLPPYLQHLVL